MANTIWKENNLIMCSHLIQNARFTGRSVRLLHILQNYALHTLCGAPHKVCNEEGKFNGSMPNRYLLNRNNGILDFICGDFFLCYAPCDSENFESMPDNLIDKYIAKFSAKGARI